MHRPGDKIIILSTKWSDVGAQREPLRNLWVKTYT